LIFNLHKLLYLTKHSHAPTDVNFKNALLAVITSEDLKSAKKIDNLTVSLALMGSAACRKLIKLTPGIHYPISSAGNIISPV